MSKIFHSLKSAFEKSQNDQRALAMQAYMRHQFVYLGISSPHRKTLEKEIFANFRNFDWSQVKDFMSLCWQQDAREYKYAAMDYASIFQKKYSAEHVDFFEGLIIDQSWWDTVDMIAPGLIGRAIMNEPQLVKKYANKWIQSEPFWYPRSALILQLFYKEKTNFDLLTQLIISHKNSKEFFIRKAAGWALRQYSKTNPEEVIQFIENHQLNPLTQREGLKWINRKKS